MSKPAKNKNGGRKTVTTGFAVVEIASGYSKKAIHSLGDRSIRCKMDKPTSVSLRSEIYDEMAELMMGMDCIHQTRQARIDEPFEDDDIPQEQNQPERPGSSTETAELLSRISELESELSKALEERNTEVRRLLSRNKELEKRTKVLGDEIIQLDSTRKHLSNELQSYRRTNIRDIMEAVMEFAAGVNNVVTDRPVPDDVRDNIDNRTERLINVLSSKGIRVTRHRRGDPIGDERADYSRTETDDSSLDMTVHRSVRYGCKFSDDSIPDIAEDVSVYVYKNGSAGSTDTDDVKTSRI